MTLLLYALGLLLSYLCGAATTATIAAVTAMSRETSKASK